MDGLCILGSDRFCGGLDIAVVVHDHIGVSAVKADALRIHLCERFFAAGERTVAVRADELGEVAVDEEDHAVLPQRIHGSLHP